MDMLAGMLPVLHLCRLEHIFNFFALDYEDDIGGVACLAFPVIGLVIMTVVKLSCWSFHHFTQNHHFFNNLHNVRVVFVNSLNYWDDQIDNEFFLMSPLGLDKICFFFYLFCFAFMLNKSTYFAFMLDKSTYFAFSIHLFCSLFHPFCFPKIPF